MTRGRRDYWYHYIFGCMPKSNPLAKWHTSLVPLILAMIAILTIVVIFNFAAYYTDKWKKDGWVVFLLAIFGNLMMTFEWIYIHYFSMFLNYWIIHWLGYDNRIYNDPRGPGGIDILIQDARREYFERESRYARANRENKPQPLVSKEIYTIVLYKKENTDVFPEKEYCWAICLEYYKENDKLAQLQWNPLHLFHLNWIKEWLKKKNKWPLCQKFFKKYS